MSQGETSLAAQIAAQGQFVRDLKARQADPAEIDFNVLTLKELKAQVPKRINSDTVHRSAGGKGLKAGKAQKWTLKTAKGTKDWHPGDMVLRSHIFRKITEVFEMHGAVTIDTPVFELKEILAGKYGEDSKLIYDLQDQGGELCSLRYDLTVPFARFLAMNGSQYPTIKRYHIAKVYRRDQPTMSKGRMREFYQCDFDVAGVYDPMLPDAECVLIACQIFESLQIGNFTVKINHRKLLDGIFAICGVPQGKTRAVSSAVDKLDKMSWEDVKREMTVEKGLGEDAADQIGQYVKLKGSEDLASKLSGDANIIGNKQASEGLKDIMLLFRYLGTYGVLDKISFDLSLARGLDYYTGIIYEVVTEASASTKPPVGSVPEPTLKSSGLAKEQLGEDFEPEDANVGVGSIAGGGRYDDLVSMFAGTSSAAGKIPCVGISFGVERIFSILHAKRLAEGSALARGKMTDVFVMAVGDGLLEERMKAEFMYKAKPKAGPQFDLIDREHIPYAVIVAPDEVAEGKVRIKQQLGKDSGQHKGDLVARLAMVPFLLEKLSTRAP